MKKIIISSVLLTIFAICLLSCKESEARKSGVFKVRPLKDTIGFAQYPWQMDSIMSRISRSGWKRTNSEALRFAICPHDDYTYVGALYPELLQHIKAPNIILLGVAHKAASMGVENNLVFDTYTHWKGPWSNIPVSPVREELYSLLKNNFAVLNDSLQTVEHSVESMIPYLQYFNRNVSIVSILVPAMNPERMEECGKALAEAIRTVATSNGWEWGVDYAIVVTTDAVHYGNEDWGGANRACFGCDDKGNEKAREHESEIIENCLVGQIDPVRIRLFSDYTIDKDNFREYKWTWCGRYCVPVALYTSYYLSNPESISGKLAGYSTSITSKHIPVDDLLMGITAIATDCHWVGYAAIGYR
jgi:AmmeMemoRadiSam system protein B